MFSYIPTSKKWFYHVSNSKKRKRIFYNGKNNFVTSIVMMNENYMMKEYSTLTFINYFNGFLDVVKIPYIENLDGIDFKVYPYEE